jgi:RNA polymerase sigma-70 factor (ECF subfamily)
MGYFMGVFEMMDCWDYAFQGFSLLLTTIFIGVAAVSGASRESSREADIEMIRAVRDGHSTAYQGLVEKYQSRIYNLIYGMVRNREDARDLTQDAFVKAYQKLDSFRLEASFYTWMYRIASNVSIDFIRKAKRRGTTEFDESIAVKESDGAIADSHHVDSPSKELERKQLYGNIMSALQKLPEDQRQAVLLRELEGFSYKEISDIMGIPEGTVMSRLFYARKRLQQLLSSER